MRDVGLIRDAAAHEGAVGAPAGAEAEREEGEEREGCEAANEPADDRACLCGRGAAVFKAC